MNYKFSIITCTKNSAKYLKDNMESVRSQTFKDYEHLFIDGLSTDGTKEMISEYQKSDPKNICFFHLEPTGIADAMNYGIKMARGKYIIHLHSDDYLHDRQVLQDVSDFLDIHDPDWTYSNELWVNHSRKPSKIFFDHKIFHGGSKSALGRYLLKYFDYVRHQSVFIKKDVFDRFGPFDNKFEIAMDYEYWLRIKDRTKWIFFDQVVDCFRIHDNSVSTAPLGKINMNIDEMRAGKLYMNKVEFYIFRPTFKIIAKLISSIMEQVEFYRIFRNDLK